MYNFLAYCTDTHTIDRKMKPNFRFPKHIAGKKIINCVINYYYTTYWHRSVYNLLDMR